MQVQSLQPPRIRVRNRGGLSGNSEGRIVPFEGLGQHNPAQGKGPYFIHATYERRVRRLRCRYQLH